MMSKILVLAVLIMMATASVSYADTSCDLCAKADGSNTNWLERSTNQLLQGSFNAVFGSTEIVAEPIRVLNDGSNVPIASRFINGMLQGWGKAIIYTGAGVLEGLTAWTPTRIVPNTTCPHCREVVPKMGEAISTLSGNW